ncbi:hypothetical protein RvY_10085-2 [Ramazzottius varieornatus]|uniref:RNA polymerase II subunit A C-terminal domain phosphatase n=1 Tax=Ramazzottius varieornatus TaxID=947166 RepID=A0A1D1VE07_RAMVA|nr:hypothetical protein RvY_10085-2 [Ramazzottius varieornatus]
MDDDLETVSFTGSPEARVIRLKVQKNEVVRKDQVLILFDGPDVRLRAKFMGSVLDILVREGDTVQDGTPLFRMKKGCPHSIVMKDMCAHCGADLRLNGVPGARHSTITAAVPVVHNIPELIVSNEHASRLGQDDLTKLLKSRRLVLIVDLDQTIIHTTMENVSNQRTDIHHFQFRPGKRYPWYHTKLRPGLLDFLKDLKKSFELHIFTLGTRLYAHHIAKIIDPDGSLFSHRILSRDEHLEADLKSANMKAIFPVGDQMVCIIDDRDDVWNYAPNLLHVKPYHYFKNVGDINAPPRKNSVKESLKESTEKANGISPEVKSGRSADDEKAAQSTKEINGQSSEETTADSTKNKEAKSSEAVRNQYQSRFADEGEDEADDYLLYLKQALLTIHSAFYRIYDENETQGKKVLPSSPDFPDLKNIVPYVRKKVLKDCNLVFTGLFPHDVKSDEKEKAFALAKSFGANVDDDLVLSEKIEANRTTHLIASKDGTVKVTQARKAGNIFVVSPEWLTECIRRWERVDERLYPLKEGGKFIPPSTTFPKRNVPSSESVPSTSQDTAEEGQPSYLQAISDKDLQDMEDEIDEAMGGNDDDEEEFPEASDSNLDKDNVHEGCEEAEEVQVVSLKRKLDEAFGEDGSDEDEFSTHLKSDQFSISSTSSSPDEHLFSDDDDTLGQMAADLDRELE